MDSSQAHPGERMMSSSAQTVEAEYEKRVGEYRAKEAVVRRLDQRLAHLRVVLFLASAACFVVAVAIGPGRPWYWLGGGIFVAFVAIVAWHDRVCQAGQVLRLMRGICERGLARRRRDWDRLPPEKTAGSHLNSSTARDLDLFGKASLLQLVNTSSTKMGRETLAGWFRHGAAADEVRERQQAVAELAGRVEARETLNLAGQLVGSGNTSPEQFMGWAESEPWLTNRPWLLWLSRLLPALAIGTLALVLFGGVPTTAGMLVVMGLLAMNCALSVFFTGQVHELFKAVSTRNGEAGKYLEMFALMEEVAAESSKVRSLQESLGQGPENVLVLISRLRQIMFLANISHSPLFFLLVYVPLQVVTLWDFHILYWLELWQQRHGRAVRTWFGALGEFEALVSLATLQFEHPDWCLPEVDSSAESLTATHLGHPLLSDGGRVGNDVSLGPTGSFLLVTGSNMSGKSTLLRAIGTNAVLALAGGPVCAKQLRLPPLEVATSMRVVDSLADGVSFFMAELKRLKEIVDLAEEVERSSDRRLLYLLDEILQGTNSQERRIAVERVVGHLVRSGAWGAVSTHDLELAHGEALQESCRAVHFRESFREEDGRSVMSFDYVMHNGVATTRNALKLLELVGLK